MESMQGLTEVSEMSPDSRVRVFRRTLSGLEDFEVLEVDAYLIVGERYAFLFDTMVCPEDVAGVMSLCAPEIGKRQLLCINSHADWDHIWGNAYFSDEQRVPILALEHCRQRILSEQARLDLAEYQARYHVFHKVKLVPPSLTFSQRLTIVDGGLTIELQHAPGHCPDQIVAWLPQSSLLLAFDAVEKPLPGIDDACIPSMFATLEGLSALNAQHVLCSHGKTTSPALIQENLAYLRELSRRGRLLLERRTPAETELGQTAELIGYPFTEVVAGINEEIDRTYYSQAHERNAQAVLRWLMAQRA